MSPIWRLPSVALTTDWEGLYEMSHLHHGRFRLSITLISWQQQTEHMFVTRLTMVQLSGWTRRYVYPLCQKCRLLTFACLIPQRTIIIQHRVRDYGLEHCTVKLMVSHSTGSGHALTAREYGHVGERPYLTLWRLEDTGSKAVLASSALPASLSSRKELLGDMILDGMRPVESPSFACDMGSIQTLEIAVACASDPCIMEFRLTQSPRQGAFLVYMGVKPASKYVPAGFWVVQSEQNSTSA